jgi:VWFA-related protein
VKTTLSLGAALAALLTAPLYGSGQGRVFRAGVDSVLVDVSVRQGNRPVAGLGRSDFIIYDNDVRQEVESVSFGKVPVDVTFFLGSNNQTKTRQLGAMQEQVREVVRSLGPEDRVRVLTLQNAVVDLFGWRSRGDADAAMDVRLGGIQSLYDGVLVSLLHRPSVGRRHLVIVLTDGVEHGSVVDSKTVLDVARRADVRMYVVFVDPPAAPPAALNLSSVPPDLNLPGGRGPLRNSMLAPPGATGGGIALRATWFHVMADEKGTERLGEAAVTTGGTVRHVDAETSIADSFRRAFQEFRQSYLIRYSARGVAPEGWHELRVELANGRAGVVQARRGYFGGSHP